jgi:hypothetical protein
LKAEVSQPRKLGQSETVGLLDLKFDLSNLDGSIGGVTQNPRVNGMYLKADQVDCHDYHDKWQMSEDSDAMILELFEVHCSGARDIRDLGDLVAWADIALTAVISKQSSTTVSSSMKDLGNTCTDKYVAYTMASNVAYTQGYHIRILRE